MLSFSHNTFTLSTITSMSLFSSVSLVILTILYIHKKKNKFYFFNGTKYSIIFSFYIIPKKITFFNDEKYLIILSYYIVPKKKYKNSKWCKILNNFFLLNITKNHYFFLIAQNS